jgi:hypothetical protein
MLLKKSTNVLEQRWMVVSTELGLAWCQDQAGRREDAIKAYRKALKSAWRIEVTGDFDFKQWTMEVWDDVSSLRNPIHSRQRGLCPGVCFSQEIITYLLKLLDPVRDAKEIAKLKSDEQKLDSMPRAITPILVPLLAGAPLDDLVNTNAAVSFDLDGTGMSRKWGWITPKAAWLVYDSAGCGQVTSGLQMFGNVTFWIFWGNGYEALSALDDNGDGVLTGVELRNLALWKDANSNGVSEPGEVLPLEAFGITALSCKCEIHESGIPWIPAGVQFKDGTSRPSYDWVTLQSSGDGP